MRAFFIELHLPTVHLNAQTALLRLIDERKGAACGVHGGRRYDRPGGGIPSLAQGKDARSERCEVRAPGRNGGAAKDREAELLEWGIRNAELGMKSGWC